MEIGYLLFENLSDLGQIVSHLLTELAKVII
jgi:hypothetical protein